MEHTFLFLLSDFVSAECGGESTDGWEGDDDGGWGGDSVVVVEGVPDMMPANEITSLKST